MRSVTSMAWISRSSSSTCIGCVICWQGNFGLSLEYQRPNADLIREQLGLTVALAAMAFVLTWLIAVPVGIYSATHQRSVFDHLFTVINYVGVATPNFMLALILMWIAFTYFVISITGLFSPHMSMHTGVWAVFRFAGAHLAARPGAGHRGHRAVHAHHAGEPAG